jgi:hypothetical protein
MRLAYAELKVLKIPESRPSNSPKGEGIPSGWKKANAHADAPISPFHLVAPTGVKICFLYIFS